MTFAEFDKYTEEILGKVRKMRDSKGIEYTGAGSNVEVADRFANFNRSAEKIKITRMQAWFILFDKHYHSLVSYINNEREFSDEGIEGRIVDMLTYLILAGAMIKEDKARISPSKIGISSPKYSPLDEEYWRCPLCLHDPRMTNIWLRPDEEHCPKCGNKRIDKAKTLDPQMSNSSLSIKKWLCHDCHLNHSTVSWNSYPSIRCHSCSMLRKESSLGWLDSINGRTSRLNLKCPMCALSNSNEWHVCVHCGYNLVEPITIGV